MLSFLTGPKTPSYQPLSSKQSALAREIQAIRASGSRSPDRLISERLDAAEVNARHTLCITKDELVRSIPPHPPTNETEADVAELKQQLLNDITTKLHDFEAALEHNGQQLKQLNKQGGSFFYPGAQTTKRDKLYEERANIIDGVDITPPPPQTPPTLIEEIQAIRAGGGPHQEQRIRQRLEQAEEETRTTFNLTKDELVDKIRTARTSHQYDVAQLHKNLWDDIAKRAGNFEALLKENNRQLRLIDTQGDIFHTPTAQYDGVYYSRIEIIQGKEPSVNQTQAEIIPSSGRSRGQSRNAFRDAYIDKARHEPS